jgi:hypothetical protein
MKPFILSLVLASLPLPVIGQATASGSGFFVSRAGHLITNEHVVADANEILVTLADGKQLPATVLLANPAKDIAVLKIDAQTTPLWLGESDQVDVLDPVSAFGFPLADNLGKELSAYSGRINAWRNLDQQPLLQMDAQVNPGSSGGPVIAEDGGVIGITVSGLNPLFVLQQSGKLVEGVKFAIPSDEIRSVLKGLSVPLAESAKLPDGEKLFNVVRPSMAFVEVKLAPPLAAVPDRETTGSANARDNGEQNVTSFISRFIRAGEGISPEAVMRCYAGSVDYFEEGVRSSDQIKDDVVKHFAKWPTRSYRLVGEPLEAGQEGTEKFITYEVFFEVSDGKKKIEGLSRNMVSVDATEMKITAIREKVVKRKTTTIGR